MGNRHRACGGVDGLERVLGVNHECFASPLNCHFPAYCSAFLDTDTPFGSRGSFFDWRPTSGYYEANPPFVNGIMLAMAQRLDELLEAATRDQTHSQKPWTAASQLRAGIINVAIGLGLMLLFVAMRPDEDWLWVIGAIPTMIGLGFLLIWRIETRQQRSYLTF